MPFLRQFEIKQQNITNSVHKQRIRRKFKKKKMKSKGVTILGFKQNGRYPIVAQQQHYVD